MKQQLAFIGLGVMGYPMAGHLANSGHDVVVFNRTFDKAEKWSAEYPGRVAKTAAEAARSSDVVFIVLAMMKMLKCCSHQNKVFWLASLLRA